MKLIFIISCLILVSCKAKRYGTLNYVSKDRVEVKLDGVYSDLDSLMTYVNETDLDSNYNAKLTQNSIADTTTLSSPEINKIDTIDLPIKENSTNNIISPINLNISIVIHNIIGDKDSISTLLHSIKIDASDSKYKDSIGITIDTLIKVSNEPTIEKIINTPIDSSSLIFTDSNNLSANYYSNSINPITIDSIPDTLLITEANNIAEIDHFFNGSDTLKVVENIDSLDFSKITSNNQDSIVPVIQKPNSQKIIIIRDTVATIDKVSIQTTSGNTILDSNKQEEPEITSNEFNVINQSDEPIYVNNGKVIKTFTFYFNLGKETPENFNSLIDSIQGLVQNNSEVYFLLAGHTDKSGNQAKNLSLSMKRTEKIKSKLIEKGIHPKDIYIQFFGEKFARQEESAEERKVECLIIEKPKQ